jgi:hypothetical protein
MKKLLMIANVDWFFISHRLVIAEEAKKQGFDNYVSVFDYLLKEIINNDNKLIPS